MDMSENIHPFYLHFSTSPFNPDTISLIKTWKVKTFHEVYLKQMIKILMIMMIGYWYEDDNSSSSLLSASLTRNRTLLVTNMIMTTLTIDHIHRELVWDSGWQKPATVSCSTAKETSRCYTLCFVRLFVRRHDIHICIRQYKYRICLHLKPQSLQ